TTFGPKARNSEVRRRLASTCRLRRAAVMVAPATRASRMTKRRPRCAKSNRRTMRKNIQRLLVEDAGIIRLGGWGRVRSGRRGGAGARSREALPRWQEQARRRGRGAKARVRRRRRFGRGGVREECPVRSRSLRLRGRGGVARRQEAGRPSRR